MLRVSLYKEHDVCLSRCGCRTGVPVALWLDKSDNSLTADQPHRWVKLWISLIHTCFYSSHSVQNNASSIWCWSGTESAYNQILTESLLLDLRQISLLLPCRVQMPASVVKIAFTPEHSVSSQSGHMQRTCPDTDRIFMPGVNQIFL